MSRILGFFSEKSTDSGTDLTTKGDIHGYSDTNTRIPVGSNDQVLTADSSEALGLKWATASASTFDSYYETQSALTVVQGQHFIEWFTGQTLDTTHIWNKTNVYGGGGTAQLDTSNDNRGVEMVPDTAINSWINLDFNSVTLPFDYTDCAMIAVVSAVNGSATGGIQVGLGNALNTTEANSVRVKNDSGEGAYMTAFSKSGSGSSSVSTGVATDFTGVFYVYKIILSTTSIKYYVNGVLTNTLTTNYPTVNLQPLIVSINRTAGQQQLSYCRYYEAWNT